MNISDVAQTSGLPVKTIRYYADIGLIQPTRGANGYRNFSEADGHQLKFLAKARSLGFSIDDCRALLSLYEDKDRASADVKKLAQKHIENIERKIAELESLREAVSALVEGCRGDHRPDCPIIDGLAGNERK